MLSWVILTAEIWKAPFTIGGAGLWEMPCASTVVTELWEEIGPCMKTVQITCLKEIYSCSPERRRDDAEEEDAEEEDADERERRAQRAAAANARADDDASIRPNERTRGKDAARGERTTDRRGARAEVRADLRRRTRGAPNAITDNR